MFRFVEQAKALYSSIPTIFTVYQTLKLRKTLRIGRYWFNISEKIKPTPNYFCRRLERTKEVINLIFVKNMQATLLWDCISIGRSKIPNSTNQSIVILIKFTYNVKNRKFFYFRFVEPSECTKRPELIRVLTVIKGPNRPQSAFKA